MIDIVGAWHLESYEQRSPDGSVSYPMGVFPSGILIYSESGHMSVVLCEVDRPPFETSDRSLGKESDEEAARAYRTYGSYFGRYEIDESAGIVTHHVEANLFPNGSGMSRSPKMTLDGDTLNLELSTLPTGVSATLTWIRAKSEDRL